jgi:predicted DNA-binding antitoxin AbrB/MazE fold protein
VKTNCAVQWRKIELAEAILMTRIIRAVYEGGVLRPVEPLALAEGQTVDVTIAATKEVGPSAPVPTSEEEDYMRRIKAAKSLEEMYTVMETAPTSPDYDIVKMVNESRRLTGFRMPDPDSAHEELR